MLELDVTDEDHLDGLAAAVREHVDGLDGVVHSIAYGNPETLLGGKFLGGPWADVAQAVQVSAYSLMSLAGACRPLMADGRLDRRDDLRRHRRLAGVRLDGRGQGRPRVDARATWPATSARRDPGQPGLRRPAEDPCRQGDPRLRGARVDVERPRAARLGRERPEPDRAGGRAPCFSDFFPATTGEIVHVDGGFHAMGA